MSIMESGITESDKTQIVESVKKETGITESGLT